jgi:hypothetical protein
MIVNKICHSVKGKGSEEEARARGVKSDQSDNLMKMQFGSEELNVESPKSRRRR